MKSPFSLGDDLNMKLERTASHDAMFPVYHVYIAAFNVALVLWDCYSFIGAQANSNAHSEMSNMVGDILSQ